MHDLIRQRFVIWVLVVISWVQRIQRKGLIFWPTSYRRRIYTSSVSRTKSVCTIHSSSARYFDDVLPHKEVCWWFTSRNRSHNGCPTPKLCQHPSPRGNHSTTWSSESVRIIISRWSWSIGGIRNLPHGEWSRV